MAVYKDSSRLEWFMAAWAEQRQKAARLLGRITDLGPLQAMTPKVLHKFLRLMDQVAEAKQAETKIISNINAIEEQHRFRRAHKQLRQACAPERGSSILPSNNPVEDHPRPQRPWMWLFILWYLFMRKQINQEKPRP